MNNGNQPSAQDWIALLRNSAPPALGAFVEQIPHRPSPWGHYRVPDGRGWRMEVTPLAACQDSGLDTAWADLIEVVRRGIWNGEWADADVLARRLGIVT